MLSNSRISPQITSLSFSESSKMGLKGSLDKNADVRSVSTDQRIQIEEFIGSGGQGEVFRVTYAGKSLALKWFFDNTSSADQRRVVENLVRQGKPSNNFLWPMELAKLSGSNAFGYLMELREKRFQSFDSIVTAKVDPSFSVLMTVGLNLIESFHDLHAKGLCYRDINFGNGFFDLSTGEVLICDNDNVAENHSDLKTVLGTPDFMAPEVVLGQAHPSRETDYFSLSVLLFYLFHIQHPLLGKKILAIRSWDLPAREKLFGKEPVFIFDPKDKSNEAIDSKAHDPLGEAGKNAIPYWNNIYPKVLKDAFLESFTVGIRRPEKRLIGPKWKQVLSDSKDSIFMCSNCGKENFFEATEPTRHCWNCGAAAKPPYFLETLSRRIALSKGTRISEYHVASNKTFDPHSPLVGDIVEHPTNRGVFGLCNRTSGSWSADVEGGKTVEVLPGKSIPLHHGTTVRIGNNQLKIVAT
jgi:serine/threonine protein kinase